jgi:hypothetical protein
LADLLENHFERDLVKQFIQNHQLEESTVNMASTFTQVKWTCSTINYLIILVGLGLMLKRWIINKSQTN